MFKIYLVEDDINIREIVKYALETMEYDFYEFESSEEFWQKLKFQLPDLIVLDIMLPKESGIEILKKLKASEDTRDIPIIVLSAKASEFDKLACFDLGVDDYITKPFSVLELLARVKVIVKRLTRPDVEKIVFKNIEIDLRKRVVYVNEEEVVLTLKEYEILKYLLLNINIVIEREKLVRKIWGYDYEGDSRTVDVHINTLRRKLGVEKDVIKTIRGVGYIINE